MTGNIDARLRLLNVAVLLPDCGLTGRRPRCQTRTDLGTKIISLANSGPSVLDGQGPEVGELVGERAQGVSHSLRKA